MPRIATKLVAWQLLKLHKDIPLQEFCFRPAVRVGGMLLAPGVTYIDRDTDKVVAGLVALQSAEAASHGGKITVKVLCLYVDGVPETFATSWPKIEQTASQLTKTDCENLLVALLKCHAACVEEDNGLRLSLEFDISYSQLKRLRRRALKEQQPTPGELAKNRKPRNNKNLSDTSSAPMNATSASNAPEDQAPVETDASASAVPSLQTDLAMDAQIPVNTATSVSLDSAPLATDAVGSLASGVVDVT